MTTPITAAKETTISGDDRKNGRVTSGNRLEQATGLFDHDPKVGHLNTIFALEMAIIYSTVEFQNK